MTIQDESIDAIGVHKATGNVLLYVFDHLDWSDPQAHYALLARKLNIYLHFVESGQAHEAAGAAHDSKCCIKIDLSVEPGDGPVSVLERLRDVAQARQVDLDWEVK